MPEPTLTTEVAARELRAAAITRTPVPALRERMDGLTPDLAYAIQDTNTRAWLGDGEPIAAGRLIQPKVEAEIALLLRADLPHERHTYADLIRATECVLPAIEIVDSRIEAWNIRFVDTVADNASSGLYVLGSRPRKLRDVDLVGCAMQMKRGEDVVSTGSGRACLGNPLTAAVWLADVMVKYGRPLQAGDIVLTGALGPMVAVGPGDRFEATVEGLGSVVAQFD